MKRFVPLMVVVACGSTQAFAEPQFLKSFKAHYKIQVGSALDRASCAICHAGPPKRNPYGKTIEGVLTGDDLTVAAMQQAEKADSDGDGVSNIDEIQADTLPGDPGSKPAGKGAGSSSGGGLIPTHTFHPALVHFPIALFMFGALLEFFGAYRKDDVMRKASRLCVLGGTAALLIAIPTGIIASLRLGYGIGPDSASFTHLLIALGAGLTMVLTCIAGKKGNQALYWGLLGLGSILVGLAGHFGGLLVFGG